MELFRALPHEILAAIAGVALVIAGSQAILLAWRKASRRQTILKRVARAAEGEARAIAWLTELGYDIIGAQVAADYPVCVDRETITVGVRADYLVQRSGATYVVEVKTGHAAPRVETPATRRQLLEYRIAFDVDGVLLVDAEAQRVHAVSFPRLSVARPKRPWRLGWLAFALALIAVVAVFART